MSVLDSLLERGSAQLRKAGIESPQREARLLLAYVLGISQEELIAGHGMPNTQAMLRFESILRRRIAREPIAYIVGEREFWSLPFAVGPGVLVPRPDSETLIEQALRAFPDADAALNVLDLGTGSGCLLLAFLHERPYGDGIGIDISTDALTFAMDNAQMLGLAGRTRFFHGTWMANLRGSFDVIFINPPYVAQLDIAGLDPEVGLYEPASALAGGTDGLEAYRQIAPGLGAVLAPEGKAFVEIGAGQAADVERIFAAAGLNVTHIAPDLAGIPRCLVVERRSG
jgi:release factor glutamine methyltransferase